MIARRPPRLFTSTISRVHPSATAHLKSFAEKREALVLSEHIEAYLAQLLGNSGRDETMSHLDKEHLYEWRGYLLLCR